MSRRVHGTRVRGQVGVVGFFFPSTMGVPGIQLRLSGLVAGVLTC